MLPGSSGNGTQPDIRSREGGPFGFDHVRTCEHEQIRKRRSKFDIHVGNEENGSEELLGLAISGGGIRSATFSLGVIQRLAEGGLLKQVDYLSTVSGGGYIGSWLFSWIRGEGLNGNALPQVENSLRTDREHECEEITFLREYSNYLTPRVSLFSADTWVVAAIWSRNTLLNLTILLAAFAAAVLFVRWFGLLGASAARTFGWTGEWSWPLAMSAGLLLPMVGCIGWNLWKNSKVALNGRPPRERTGESSNGIVFLFCFSPLASAIVYTLWLGKAPQLFVAGTLWQGIEANFLVLWPAFLFIQSCALLYQCHLKKEEEMHGAAGKGDWLLAWFSYLYAPLVAALATAALLRLVALLLATQAGHPDKPWFAFTFGPPLVMLAFTLGMVVHIGLMGRDLPEASREWLGRLRGWFSILTMAWIAATAVSIYGPWLVAWIGVESKVAIATLGGGWILSTAAGLVAGNSAKTNGKTPEGATQPRGKSVLEVIAVVAPYVFMAGFTVLVAFGVHAILAHGLRVVRESSPPSQVEKYDLQVKNDRVQLSREPQASVDGKLEGLLNGYWNQLTCTELLANNGNPVSKACLTPGAAERWALSGLLPLLAVLLSAGALLAWRVDINVFSMHNFYKNRLVRCYLGASRRGKRKPSPFTGFDDFDDTLLHDFTIEKNYVGPYPIVNATLNVASGGKLQYQERKAESFIFTPLYTGFDAETTVAKMRLSNSEETTPAESHKKKKDSLKHAVAYRPTKNAGGGVSVGMAMAISGAAANPNMGYHTAAAVSFLLTVFNVRLGWWFANTLKKTFNSPGPAFGLVYSFEELFGVANADGKYLSLSDGGHFENMGIYELVRRRCRYIICCDGEQDENLTFGGIGNAVRKCRTDFGVDIDLPTAPLRKQNDLSGAHCVVGRIKYPPSATEAEMEGYLLYLKSSLTGDEATDVLEYRARQPAFPQQTTADQWFDESQFESYRKLGHHIADKALSAAVLGDTRPGARETFFKSLYQIWYPPSATVEKNSPAHTDMYSRILESVRNAKSLPDDFDSNLFEAYVKDHAGYGWDHNSGHLCNSFIQLMERVFYDLGLEDRDTWQHPYVEGWLDIFGYWTKKEPFRKTWAVTKDSYPERFCYFYESMVKRIPKNQGGEPVIERKSTGAGGRG